MEQLRNSINRFYSLPDKDWDIFTSIWKPDTIAKNEILTRVGEVEKHMYFVNKGVLRGFFVHQDSEFTLGFSYDGDFSGIPDSFMNQVPSMYFLETLSPCEVLKTTYDKLQQAFDASREVERLSRIMAEKMLYGFSLRQVELQCMSAEERFKAFLRRSPHLLQMIPQKYLASYLNMAPETFSRLIRNVRI
ncbi:Crp/Fnr family transcriptional regulator [Chondrinema litorale]|uniref:Crp/Fnr family transcriptional regulator n=1 Tax=Chondrinema litorale TaxID=2994555 RepID=UPI00254399C7|nr:Crp/Fnr family transcriptional regulator [Chondrinema litorale]UZR93348.1 Crp/Fnr family transcriptional regulator [Chondrinema litorale]